MRKVVIENALKVVRQRFVSLTSSRFSADSMEHDIVLYRSKMVFNKTVIGGKYARPSLSLQTFQAIKPFSTPDEIDRVAQVVATMEMVQSSYLILDDIMDESETRRGKPCWYKTPNIGFGAINDALLLESFVEEIIRDVIPTHPNLQKILDAFNRSQRNTVLGQFMDSDTQHRMASFTWERYEKLVQFKTSHYSYFLPVEVALLLADVNNGFNDARKLCYMIGFLFQAQDDFIDVYGDPVVTGKIGTDLKDGKCTWLTVRAVQKLQNHKELLKEWTDAFGKSDDKSISKLKEILNTLQLDKEFRIFESKFAENIIDNFKRVDEQLKPVTNVLHESLDALVGRVK